MKVYADTFPAGTLTGTPKIRTMQLICNIEKQIRGGVWRLFRLHWFQRRFEPSHYYSYICKPKQYMGALKKAIDKAAQLKN